MSVLRGFAQFALLLAANGAALFAITVATRCVRRLFGRPNLSHCAPKATRNVAPKTAAIVWKLPDISPALFHFIVRNTPKPELSARAGRDERTNAGPSLLFLLLPGICMSLISPPAHAQGADTTINLPPLSVDAPAQSCVDVEVEGERQPAFDCLNDQLKVAAQSATSSDPDAQLKAVAGNGAPNKVGTFSYTGESIRMGDAFGKSAFPQRPSAPVYSNALTAGVK